MPKSAKPHERRQYLLEQVQQLAQIAIFGNATETFRKCGNRGCRCHHGGPKHGPHVYISARVDGRTKNTYVPKHAQDKALEGVEAWKQLQECLRELAEMNKQRALAADPEES